MFERFTLIAGPCVLEDDELNLKIAHALRRISEEFHLPVVFKASFDKANRAKGDSPRGPGLKEGMKRLARVKEETGLPLLTDIHMLGQAYIAAQTVDALQVPAFLCRQTDLLLEVARMGRAVNVKKGQWMGPEEMVGVVEKLRSGGAKDIAVTERGTFFGYGDLIVDMRSFRRMRDSCTCPVVFDGTHSVQRPGREWGSSGGDPEYIEPLVLAAVAAGCDSLFLEVHPNPENAPSDGASMLPLDLLKPLLEKVLRIRQ